MLGNADTILSIESPSLVKWRPTIEELANIAVPVDLIVADDTLPVYKQVSGWLAAQLRIEPARRERPSNRRATKQSDELASS